MKTLLSLFAALLCLMATAQTRFGMALGAIEQSNILGVGAATTFQLEQNLVGNGGVAVEYAYGTTRYEPFQELSLTAYHEFPIGRLSLKPKVGASRQVSGPIYPTFGFDMLVSTGPSSQIVLGWQPTVRGHFRDPATGWSMITTLGILIQIL